MLKNGDIVAYREAPTVPIGKVRVSDMPNAVTGTAVDNNGRVLTTFFLSNGCADSPARPHRDDVVLYAASGGSTHYIVIRPETGNKYESLQAAQTRVDELLRENPNQTLRIYKIVEERSAEVTIHTKRLG